MDRFLVKNIRTAIFQNIGKMYWSENFNAQPSGESAKMAQMRPVWKQKLCFSIVFVVALCVLGVGIVGIYKIKETELACIYRGLQKNII